MTTPKCASHVLFVTVLASLAAVVSAQTSFRTGFETPDYVVGQPIAGVGGWGSAASPLAPEIVTGRSLVSNGRRALQCWGGSPHLESFEVAPGVFLLDGGWFHDGPRVPFQAGLARVQCDLRLDGPLTNTDLLSANLIARNGSYNSAQMWLSSDGNVYCNSWGTDPVTGPFEHTYQFPTPVPRGVYTTMAITYDYSVHLAVFEVAGVPVGVLPFGGDGEGGFNGVFLEFAAYDDPLTIDPSLYTGYWDNVWFIGLPIMAARPIV